MPIARWLGLSRIWRRRRQPVAGVRPLAEFMVGFGETLTLSVPIANWAVYGESSQEGDLVTSVAHGMHTVGEADPFTVSGTGGDFDAAAPSTFTDTQLGGTAVGPIVDEVLVNTASGTGGLITYLYSRVAAVVSGAYTASQATLAKQPRKESDGWRFGGTDDELVISPAIVLSGGYSLTVAFSKPDVAHDSWLLFGDSGTHSIRSFNATSLVLWINAVSFTFTIPAMTNNTMYYFTFVVVPTGISLYRNGVFVATVAGTVGTMRIAGLGRFGANFGRFKLKVFAPYTKSLSALEVLSEYTRLSA